MNQTMSYPEKILRKVTAFDSKAMDKLMSHADALFEEQKKTRYIPLKPDNAIIPNPFMLVRNLFVRSFNAAVEHDCDPHFMPASISSGYDDHSIDDAFNPKPLILSPNLLTALVSYIERDKEKVMTGTGITRQDLHLLRDYAGWGNRDVSRSPGLNA